MNATVNRQVLLVEKPSGKLGPKHFKLVSGAMPEPKDGEALLRTRLISLDAANRAWMHGATYRSAVEANSVMAGGSISEVVSSKAPNFAPGDLVRMLNAVAEIEPTDHAVLPPSAAFFSNSTVLRPKRAASAAADSPAPPPPITTTSKVSTSAFNTYAPNSFYCATHTRRERNSQFSSYWQGACQRSPASISRIVTGFSMTALRALSVL